MVLIINQQELGSTVDTWTSNLYSRYGTSIFKDCGLVAIKLDDGNYNILKDRYGSPEIVDPIIFKMRLNAHLK